MNPPEPPSLEIFITVVAGNLFSTVFKEYVDSLPLRGSERVLELGPSAGNSSRHLARRLLKGGGCLTAVDISSRWVDIARKRLRRYPNVEVWLGDIARLNIPDASQDIIFISFVIHDIPESERAGVLQHTFAKLIPGGQAFIREPLRFISQCEIHGLMQANGLEEISSQVKDIKTQGQVYEGIYRKG